MSSPDAEVVSSRRSFVSSPVPDETKPARLADGPPPELVQGPTKYKNGPLVPINGNPNGLRRRPGRGRRIYVPYRAISRLIRPRHQRPSGRGSARRRPVRPAGGRHRHPPRQKAAVFGRRTPGDDQGGV